MMTVIFTYLKIKIHCSLKVLNEKKDYYFSKYVLISLCNMTNITLNESYNR